MKALDALLFFCLSTTVSRAAKASPEPLLELTDSTLTAALEKHPILLLTVNVAGNW